jgi:UDP-N-acetylglucosamine 4,6-dehydratase
MTADSELAGAKILVTGGTGSFGLTMVKHLMTLDVDEIRILSRDENKQDNIRRLLRDERVRFFIGDVRQDQSVVKAMSDIDYVFHAAALKQVPSCEFFPQEAVQTNILGSDNVIRAAIEKEVKSVVCLSTDKAVYPINAMGMTKAVMERVAQSYVRNLNHRATQIKITRYGNVMMSRGSVIPLFRDQLRSGSPVTVTDPQMTRFLMSLTESVDLVRYAFISGKSGDVFVRKAPACTVKTLVEAIALVEGVSRYTIESIGIRHGEKQHEVLVSSEEMSRATDCGDYFQIPIDSRGLDYQLYFSEGDTTSSGFGSFSSENTVQLGVEQVAKLLRGLPEYGQQEKVV